MARIHIYKAGDVSRTILIIPASGSGLPPVLLSGVLRENLRARLQGPLDLLDRQRGARDAARRLL